jgi:hypothetical protein
MERVVTKCSVDSALVDVLGNPISKAIGQDNELHAVRRRVAGGGHAEATSVLRERARFEVTEQFKKTGKVIAALHAKAAKKTGTRCSKGVGRSW